MSTVPEDSLVGVHIGAFLSGSFIGPFVHRSNNNHKCSPTSQRIRPRTSGLERTATLKAPLSAYSDHTCRLKLVATCTTWDVYTPT
jgi:hypothetical protein